MYLQISRSDTGMAATNATNESNRSSFILMEQLVSPSRLASRLELEVDWPAFLHLFYICGRNCIPCSHGDLNCLVSS